MEKYCYILTLTCIYFRFVQSVYVQAIRAIVMQSKLQIAAHSVREQRIVDCGRGADPLLERIHRRRPRFK